MIIQVLPHLKSYLMADTLRSLKVKLPEIVGNCTPTYELEFNVVARFLDDNPSLYMPIVFRNPETVKMLKELRRSLDRALAFAKSRDINGASRVYDRSKAFFKPYLKRARSHSEACIRTLLSLSR